MKKSKIRKIIEKYITEESHIGTELFVIKRIYESDFDKLEKELQEYMDDMLLWATSEENVGEDEEK